MKYIAAVLMMFGSMLALGNLHAVDKQDDRKAPGPQETAVEKPDPPATARPRERSKPATTFRPSEKISADSAVSFPVDI